MEENGYRNTSPLAMSLSTTTLCGGCLSFSVHFRKITHGCAGPEDFDRLTERDLRDLLTVCFAHARAEVMLGHGSSPIRPGPGKFPLLDAEPAGSAGRCSIVTKGRWSSAKENNIPAIVKNVKGSMRASAISEIGILNSLGALVLQSERWRFPELLASYEEGARTTLVMRQVHGTTLEDAIKLGHPWSAADIKAFAREIIKSVAILHTLNISHSDINPGNVILERGLWSRPVLLDFGLSTLHPAPAPGAPDSQVPPSRYGTPGFAPPEGKGGGTSDPFKADAWALGSLIYWAATGQLPWGGRVPKGDPLDPFELPQEMLTGLLCGGLLAEDPATRLTPEQARHHASLQRPFSRNMSDLPIACRRGNLEDSTRRPQAPTTSPADYGLEGITDRFELSMSTATASFIDSASLQSGPPGGDADVASPMLGEGNYLCGPPGGALRATVPASRARLEAAGGILAYRPGFGVPEAKRRSKAPCLDGSPLSEGVQPPDSGHWLSPAEEFIGETDAEDPPHIDMLTPTPEHETPPASPGASGRGAPEIVVTVASSERMSPPAALDLETGDPPVQAGPAPLTAWDSPAPAAVLRRPVSWKDSSVTGHTGPILPKLRGS